MPSEVTLLYEDSLGTPELRMMKIIKLFGGNLNIAKAAGKAAVDSNLFNNLFLPGACLAMSAQTLVKLFGGAQHTQLAVQRLKEVSVHLLIYGFQPVRPHNELLRVLSSGCLVGVQQVSTGGSRFTVAHDKTTCKQFSGLSFDAAGPEFHTAFVEAATSRAYSSLLSIDEQSFFGKVSNSACNLFLLAGSEIADLDTVLARDASIVQFFSSAVPLMLFLRNCSPTAFWHNRQPTACFMVDDPPLKRRYGFLDYQKLLQVMERERFCTSIAFIPWNYLRSEPVLAELFAANPQRYSLSVHGCDHTRGEFGTSSYSDLRDKAQQALDRMRAHRKSCGVGFDEVMVFPQGIFSTQAIRALKSCNYVAAVNSTLFPVDAPDSVTLRDLLEVAVTRFSGFPLFTRRYPASRAELAFDLFLGKPAFVVEHHGFFRDGYTALTETIEMLHGIENNLRWTNLGTACSRACLEKIAPDGEVHVSFFTDRFVVHNETVAPRQYLLVRKIKPEDEIKAITVNGCQLDTLQEPECVKAQLALEPGQEAEIRIEHDQLEPLAAPARQHRLYQAKVFLRRSLSEFRDNYVDRSQLLSRAARNG